MRVRLLLAGVLCAALHLLVWRTGLIHPAHSALVATTTGDFTEGGGWFEGEPFITAAPVRAWGSWTGDDAHQGTLSLGPFPAPARLRFGLGGYPTKPGITLAVELAESGEQHPVPVARDVGERWTIAECDLPAAWVGRPIKLVARDQAAGFGGWVAVTEPLRGGRGEGNHAFYTSLAAFATNGLLLFLVWQAALLGLARRAWIAPPWRPLAAAGVVAAAAYLVFWCTFASAPLGLLTALALLASAGVQVWRAPRPGSPDPEVRQVSRLLAAGGFFLLALLHLFPTALSFDDLAANRFREQLPSDNVLPFDVASRLYAGMPPTPADAEWQSSDRPPLQVGWELLTWGTTAALGLDPRTASGTAAMWFQLLWIPAVYGLLRSLRLTPPRAAAWTAVMTLSGFFVQHTVFTWPKLASGALLCGAWAQWACPPGGVRQRRDYASGAALAALAWLAHGGAAFSLLALGPWVAWRSLRGEWRGWLLAAGVFLGLAGPWLTYQHCYEPPANRLVKWHIGGQEARDDRGTWETFRDGYRALSWEEIVARRVTNLRLQRDGNWLALGDFSAEFAKGRRTDEFFLTGRALTWWVGGFGLLGVALLRRRSRAGLLAAGAAQAGLAGWTFLTVVIWCGLMFGGGQAVIHQGSYAVMIVLFALLSAWIEAAGRGWLIVVALLQIATLATTYARPNEIIAGEPVGLPFVLLGGAALAALVAAAGWRKEDSSVSAIAPADVVSPAPASDLPAPVTSGNRLLAALQRWWRQPRITWWVLAAFALLLAARKPSALLTPQLWAEDGSVFLLEQDQLGLAALATPYMGYLHTIPRLVAALAAHLLDPAWWPAFYNGIAFAVWLAVIARTFSPRLALPHKPWLALAFFLGPQTGEILFNVTNIQWIAAFVFVQQALIARPQTRTQRFGDLALLAVVGLTGPFVIALLPLIAWRWWRDRHADNSAALLVTAICAATQAWLIHRAHIVFDYQNDPFQLFNTLIVVSRRLLIWPALGPELALSLPSAVVGLVGVTAITALFLWALRPHPRREVRAQLIAAFMLLLVAGLARMRPDTWSLDNLSFSDRYFFLPRVLLAWLILLEIDAVPRAVAWSARIVALAMALTQLPDYSLPAPMNYDWAEHCDPIRRGVPAVIPILPEGWTLDYPGRPQAKP